MQNRMNVVQKAFEQTYNRAISSDEPILSVFKAFIGWNYTKHERKGATVRTYYDRNIYNWLEQPLFLFRIAKNITKLGTEFIWNLLTESLVAAANVLFSKAGEIERSGETSVGSVASRVFGAVLLGLSFLPWIIAKAGQSITSPFAALKGSYQFFAKQGDGSDYPQLWEGMGLLAAFLRGLFTVSAYATIAIFAAPAIAAALTSIGIGGPVIAGLTVAANWVASLPVISTIGSIVAAGVTTVGSALGLSLTTGFAASAAAIASLVIAATPVLAGLKAGLRKILPWERKYIFTDLSLPLQDETLVACEPAKFNSTMLASSAINSASKVKMVRFNSESEQIINNTGNASQPLPPPSQKVAENGSSLFSSLASGNSTDRRNISQEINDDENSVSQERSDDENSVRSDDGNSSDCDEPDVLPLPQL